MPIRVVQLDVERLEPAQDCRADAPGAHRAYSHCLQIVRAGHAVRDVPAAVDDPLIRWNVITYQCKDHHHDVLRDADAVAVGDLSYGDPMLDGGLKINVVRADARCDR